MYTLVSSELKDLHYIVVDRILNDYETVCHCPNAHLFWDLGTFHNLFSYVCPFAFYTTTYPFLAISTLALPSVHRRTSLCSRANGCRTVTMATPCLRVMCILSPRYLDWAGIFWVFVCRVFNDNNMNFQNVAPENLFFWILELSFSRHSWAIVWIFA